MAKKILILSGSPKKNGNTAMLVEWFSEAARAQGATLVASFHQVEVALEHFPRVLGLRDGKIEFDCAPAALAPEDLARLYAAESGTA